jgi:hypothetical protein
MQGLQRKEEKIMSRRMLRISAVCLLGVPSAGLPGCIGVSENSPSTHYPTVGRELCDLKTAHEQGALDEQEYELARQKVMARLDKPVKA